MIPAEFLSRETQTLGSTWLVRLGWAAGWLAIVLSALAFVRRRYCVPWKQFAAILSCGCLVILLLLHRDAIFRSGTRLVIATHDVLILLLLLASLGLAGALISWGARFAGNRELSRWRRMLAVAATIAVLLLADLGGARLTAVVSGYEGELWIEPNPAAPKPAWNVVTTFNPNDAPWSWATIQWLGHSGVIVGPLLSLGLLLGWYGVWWFRNASGYAQDLLRNVQTDGREAGILAAQSAALATIASLLIYLAVAPTVITAADQRYRVQILRLTDSQATWREIAELTAQIEADSELMLRLRPENRE